MNEIEQQELIEYWKITAEHDYDTMISLFDSKHYSNSLFFGHIVLEKILKAHVVRVIKKEAPYTHDLVALHKLVGDVPLEDSEIDLLDQVNHYNIRTRYPDYKLKFYKMCTMEYTTENLEKIKQLYAKLCQQPTLKK